jgi:mRNA interferase RelE/StbE
MKTVFLRKFSKDLDKLEVPQVLKAIAEVIEQVEQAERLSEIPNVKKLSGHKNAYRIRVGDYRIGVFLEHDTVEFARVLHRKDIYDIFP